MITITVNGESVEVDDTITIERLLETRGFPEKGIAVALDWSMRAPSDRV